MKIAELEDLTRELNAVLLEERTKNGEHLSERNFRIIFRFLKKNFGSRTPTNRKYK